MISSLRITLIACFAILLNFTVSASYIFIPMDDGQTNHLKAYGIVYWTLDKDLSVDWLLNYRGGSFCAKYARPIEEELIIRGIHYEVISGGSYNNILTQIAHPESNMDVMKLDVPPKVAVYSPKSKQPWDDAVTLVLTYAEIPYEVIFDDEVMKGDLSKYDWLHLHHEDFTGQYDKFWASFRNQAWFIQRRNEYEALAKKYGFKKVTQLKLAVVKKIKEFVAGGGFMFAMCTATDTYDIALAADGVDIVEHMFDGDPMDRDADAKLNYDNTFAFRNFKLEKNPVKVEFSSVDHFGSDRGRKITEKNDYFKLFQFSAKWDPVPTMLTQNHKQVIKGFYGQTTAFHKEYLKPNVIVMGETKSLGEARYIHGIVGKGQFTFYGGHDPEDYKHYVREEPTNLDLHPRSPGYRLILNNVLFPAAKKKKRKT